MNTNETITPKEFIEALRNKCRHFGFEFANFDGMHVRVTGSHRIIDAWVGSINETMRDMSIGKSYNGFTVDSLVTLAAKPIISKTRKHALVPEKPVVASSMPHHARSTPVAVAADDNGVKGLAAPWKVAPLVPGYDPIVEQVLTGEPSAAVEAILREEIKSLRAALKHKDNEIDLLTVHHNQAVEVYKGSAYGQNDIIKKMSRDLERNRTEEILRDRQWEELKLKLERENEALAKRVNRYAAKLDTIRVAFQNGE